MKFLSVFYCNSISLRLPGEHWFGISPSQKPGMSPGVHLAEDSPVGRVLEVASGYGSIFVPISDENAKLLCEALLTRRRVEPTFYPDPPRRSRCGWCYSADCSGATSECPVGRQVVAGVERKKPSDAAIAAAVKIVEDREIRGLGDVPNAIAVLLDDFTSQKRPQEPLQPEPIPMVLHCPDCGERHVDEGEFETKIHATHSCQTCGLTWRPAVVPTVGVRFLPGFRNEDGGRTWASGEPVELGDVVKIAPSLRPRCSSSISHPGPALERRVIGLDPLAMVWKSSGKAVRRVDPPSAYVLVRREPPAWYGSGS